MFLEYSLHVVYKLSISRALPHNCVVAAWAEAPTERSNKIYASKAILSVLVASPSTRRLQNTYLPPNAQVWFLEPASFAFRHQLLGGLSPDSPFHQQPVLTSPVQIPILKLQNDNSGDGDYKFSFETANHIVRQETGRVKSADFGMV
ncbi:hypothetical protein Zmor_000762 [Zophobas morio]|uniref:Uncharacterized protein n=1 Tax=Zophobas morio TaxID=2755281 RepID=A0AA38MRR8_9CUCU|nr:hypothetical protein Zmor_000762 [Zophobas morio]